MALLQFYGMFDYTEGDGNAYEYTSAEWSQLIAAMTNTGVAAGSFSMSANGLTITVGGGTAFINGRYGYNNDSTTVQLDAETITNQRIDRIVLELDVPNRKIELKVVKGTAASSGAAAPALTQNENIYQVPLYQALITEGSTVSLTDERVISYTPNQAIEEFRSIQQEFNDIKNGDTTVYAVYA